MEAVASSKAWSEVCRKLGIPPSTGSQTHFTKRAKDLGVDSSHFLGRSWNKGRNFKKQPVEKYLIKNSTIKSSKLRDKLIESGLKKRECEICKLSKWRNETIPLELDHINSDHWDNRLENLQILCPNCHTQITIKRRSISPSVEIGQTKQA